MRLRQEGLLAAACSSVSSRVPAQGHAYRHRMMPAEALALILVTKGQDSAYGAAKDAQGLRTGPGEGLVQVSQLCKMRGSLDGPRAGRPRLGPPNRLYPLRGAS